MNESICGVDCSQCEMKDSCDGCMNTNGRPFHRRCVIAKCCHNNGLDNCGQCSDDDCRLMTQLVKEFNELGIKDMEKVECLYSLKGSYVNLEYRIPNGDVIKLLDDNEIYFGNQLSKNGTDRCFGLAADERYLLVCEYGANGENAEIIVYKKRNID